VSWPVARELGEPEETMVGPLVPRMGSSPELLLHLGLLAHVYTVSDLAQLV
jgi:hypothetical protein